jgi:hypothetical protein
MDSRSRKAVMARALVYGACTGALTGGPGLGACFALAAVAGGQSMLMASMAVTVIGGASGGLVGVAGAILPGTVVRAPRPPRAAASRS